MFECSTMLHVLLEWFFTEMVRTMSSRWTLLFDWFWKRDTWNWNRIKIKIFSWERHCPGNITMTGHPWDESWDDREMKKSTLQCRKSTATAIWSWSGYTVPRFKNVLIICPVIWAKRIENSSVLVVQTILGRKSYILAPQCRRKSSIWDCLPLTPDSMS